MQQVHGLWVVSAEEFDQPANSLRCITQHGDVIEGRLLLPADLRRVDSPQRLLKAAPYDLFFNGASTGLRVLSLDDLFDWGALVVVRGVLVRDDLTASDGVWHVLQSDGQHHSMLGHVTRPQNGGGFYTPYFLEPLEARSPRCIVFSCNSMSVSSNDMEPQTVLPDEVMLYVSWQQQPLSLEVRQSTISVLVPAFSANDS